MNNGLDASVSCLHAVQAIQNAGYKFVARYYSHNPVKNLTHAEAKALSAAGISCVAVWESAGDHSSFFSHTKGKEDAHAALTYARDVIQQPKGSAIYFAVDYDASMHDVGNTGNIQAYFQGVKEVFEAAQNPYHIGVYGSGLVCGTLLALSLVTFAWLAMPHGWAGYRGFTRWNIKQTDVLHLHGIDFDTNLSSGNGGGFLVK